MTVYIVATLLTCLLALAYERRPQWPWLVLAAAIPLAAVAACRWNTGTDFRLTYHPEYRALVHLHGAGKAPEKEKSFVRLAKKGLFGKTPQKVLRHFKKVVKRSEPGYRLLMETAWHTGIGFRGVIAFCAVVTAFCVFFAIFRFSRWPSLAAFLYVAGGGYFLSLNIMRQYLAVGIGMVALSFALDRKVWRFLVAVALAMAFHYSAFLLLACYPLVRMEMTTKRGFVLIAVALALSCFVAPVAHGILTFAGADHYASYFRSKLAKDGFEWLFFGINLCYLVMGAWYWKRACSGNRYFSVWYGMTVLGTVALAFSANMPLMKRINYYYAAPQFLMLPEMLLAEDNRARRRILTVLTVLAFVAETFVSVWVLNKNGVLPYRCGF